MKVFAIVIIFIVASLAGLFVPAVQAADRTPRIGWLNPGSPTSHGALYAAFKQGLRERGYIEGQNIVIEQRWVEGKLDRLPMVAADLVQLKPDVIVVAGANAVQATKAATTTIPIVMATTNNPVGLGFIASFARPGGNITGMSNQSEDLVPKMLEVLRAAFPRANYVGVLGNRDNPATDNNWRATRDAATILGVRVELTEARRPDEIEAAFAVIAKQQPGALLVIPDAMLISQRQRVADLAAKHRLPVMYPFREFVEVGGLMSYGASLQDNYRRAATYVDKILKGANPGDLPVEQPTKFELLINLKTAKALGITIPPELMLRADEVIQ
ncbi:MAG: ABC transporter substrate-binding protein [Burkholderiales bacterium]|nr:ABC transporter substrate-binding protein [Burkholderiales bacterium]